MHGEQAGPASLLTIPLVVFQGEKIHIGTAGVPLPRALRDRFGPGRSMLERYASRFNAVEINSTFYRLPRASTAARWAATVPEAFRFALKTPKHITHELQLRHVAAPWKDFVHVATAMEQ